MKKHSPGPKYIASITEWYDMFAMPKPLHPLICLLRHEDVRTLRMDESNAFYMDFFIISIKKSFKGKMRYGKNYYDFDEGTMGFVSPGQVIAVDDDNTRDCLGWSLLFHPDFIRNYPLGKNILNYGFFSYSVNEALHLSDKEDQLIASLISNIELEYHSPIDRFSQDVMVSHLELLLNYANRFYNRQFLTRRAASNDLLIRFETFLNDCFEGVSLKESRLPTVQSISEHLSVSPHYLSDMLRSTTGQNTQQHIHNKLIEKAKLALTTTSLSVSEIAYGLGFEYPQSFNKLFKSKTSVSPLVFRQSFFPS